MSAIQDHLAGSSSCEVQGRLTAAQLRELRCIAQTGGISDLSEFGGNHLAFYARDRVIGALLRKGLIAATPDWSLTDAGRSVVAQATA